MRCMIAVCRYLCGTAIALLSLSGCSSLETSDGRDAVPRVEVEASWAEAYHKGSLPDSEGEVFGLVLAAGRTDENLNLISTGVLANIILNVPESEDGLTDGTYTAAESKQTYTFDLGEPSAGSESIAGSQIGVRKADDKTMKLYPIEGGHLTITTSSNGSRKVSAELEISEKTILMDFSGQLVVYDLALL